ncbi:hypothetical protein K488DRAFT_42751 [Vararia minispora EC-137]|uniref:Uncharacterized protein n=1 Tax=Vararia minispora EC-137 TaxID=1314806 RepID=A0ACB8QVQ1_9AGAM|nr:hypothetical protein K488DRAFT_42751 [Vararia minispora EC-137]
MAGRTSLIALALVLFVSAAPTPVKVFPRALPSVIAVSTAKTYLSELTVAAESNSPAYDRNRFKTWDIISGTCDTRETVLKRDGTNVVVSTNCHATSGTWVSPYDGVTTTDASTFDIDHIVALKEAWISGAKDWTDVQREAFANDLTRPQLVAVDASINRSKGDGDPASFLPPLTSFQCEYVRAYISVKHSYALSVDVDEKAAMQDVLNNVC